MDQKEWSYTTKAAVVLTYIEFYVYEGEEKNAKDKEFLPVGSGRIPDPLSLTVHAKSGKCITHSGCADGLTDQENPKYRFCIDQ